VGRHGKHSDTEAGKKGRVAQSGRQAHSHRSGAKEGRQAGRGSQREASERLASEHRQTQAVVGRLCSQAESSTDQKYIERETDAFQAEVCMLGEAGRDR
jgi:hypothetical protein